MLWRMYISICKLYNDKIVALIFKREKYKMKIFKINNDETTY